LRLSTNHRRRKAADRLRNLAIVLLSLGVWAGAFALIVSGSDRRSAGAPVAPTQNDVAAPASDYAKMLQEIASRAPDYYSGGAFSANGSDSGNANGNRRNAAASAAKPKAGDTPQKASRGNRPRVAVAGAPVQTPMSQALLSAPDATLPPKSPIGSSTSTTTTTVGNPVPNPIISLDDSRLTPAQRTAAQTLIDTTTYAMSRFPTEQSVLDAGYVWIGDTDANGFQTYVNPSYLSDGLELDLSHIESIVLQRDATGAAKVVAAAYILEPTKTIADVPDIAGALTTWRTRDLCLAGSVFSPRFTDGTCEIGSLPVVQAPSLHVWLVPNVCGPFADIAVDAVTCEPASP
jgi:hypothetical protein